jgi:DNA gyrase subunit A
MLRTAQRGSIGQNALQFNSQSDVLAGLATDTVENLAYIFTSQGRLGKIPIDTLNIDGSEGAGKRLFKLTAGETIIKVWSAM